MPFDPSTATPLDSGFDPSSAKPVTAAGKYLKPQTDQGLGFYKGFTTPWDNAASALSWAAHKIPLPLTNENVGGAIDQMGNALGLQSLQQANAGHKAYIAQQQAQGKVPGAVGEMTGGLLSTLPIAAATGGAGPLTSGAVTGALMTEDPSLSGITKAAGAGALFGKLGDATIGAVSRAISPQVSAAVQKLMNAGVRLTPGQIIGGTTKRLEDAAMSIPLVGDAIGAARKGGLDTFNRAMVNHVLGPIGESLPQDVGVGRDAVEYAGQKISGAYDKLLPTLTVRLDPQFTSQVANLKTLAQNMAPAQQDQFNNILKSQVLDKFTGTGAMSGDTLKDIETTLGQTIRRYSAHTASPADLDLRDSLRELQSQMRDLVMRNNPAAAGSLAAINKSYAGLLRIENAAGRSGAENGVFTAPQFSAAVRALDSSARKRAFSRGNAMLQDFADAGKEVLPSKVPDSGTAKRVMTGGLAGAGLHFAAPVLDPTLLGLLGATGGAWGAYSKPGLAVIAALLAKRPQGAQALARSVKMLRAPATAGAAVYGTQQLGAP